MMEGHRCKLCLKTFINGRALGGHMRSHMFNLPLVPKPLPLVADDHLSASSSSSQELGEGKEGTDYELREDNPKTSIRLVDHDFSFVDLQDRESETESSKNPTRRRSRRIKPPDDEDEEEKATKFVKLDTVISNNNQASKTESWTEASSISNATTEEDVAFCLMLLSKDRSWNKETEEEEEEEETEKYTVDETEDDDSSEEEENLNQSSKNRGKYKCESCNKVFKSYQALGGHRASHKKIRVIDSAKLLDPVTPPDKKIHECPVCYRVFSSGQALGGHKRSHVMAGAVLTTTVRRSSTKFGDMRNSSRSNSFIDLNLPAPPEELEDFSQMELSQFQMLNLSTK